MSALTRSGPSESQKQLWVLVAAIVGSSMTFIDGQAVNVSLPIVQRDLHASSPEMQWVIEGYSLLLSALILTGGALGDLYGRKRLFLIGVAIFAGASVGCGFAPNIDWLIAARCVQGAGAALAMPESLALISAAFTGAARGSAIGTWSAFASLTAAGGPVLGGWLAEHASWRYIFWINIPLAILVFMASPHVPESRDEDEEKRLDLGGAVLATLGLGALVFGLIEWQTPGVGAMPSISVVTGTVLLLVMIAYEARFPVPMLPLGMFESRPFTLANVYTLLLYASLGGAFYFMPFILVDVQKYTPTAAGAALLPFVALQVLFSRWSGALAGRIGARSLMVLGATLSGAGFALFALPGIAAGPYWTTYFPAALVFGIGGVFFVAPLTATVFDAAPVERSGVASGINNAVARTAGLVAIAAFGIIFGVFAPGGTADPTLGHQIAGFRAVMWVSVALCLLAAATACLLPRKPVPPPKAA